MKSFMRCKRCGMGYPIPRKASKRRKRGCIKTMWCPWCKKVTQRVEEY